MPGAGKTTVGKALAYRWAWKFVDLDAEIEQRYAMTIPAIFDRYGEEQFRRWEADTLHRTVDRFASQCVIACGGGTPMRQASRKLMRTTGYTVFLDVDISLLYRRLLEQGHDQRPMLKHLQGKELLDFLHNMYRQRIGIYRQADIRIVIDQELAIRDVCYIIEKKLEGFTDGDLTLRPNWKSD